MSNPEPVTRTVSPLMLMPVTFDTLNLGETLAGGGVDFTGDLVADGLAEVGFCVGRAVEVADFVGDADDAVGDFEAFPAPVVGALLVGGATKGAASTAAGLDESAVG